MRVNSGAPDFSTRVAQLSAAIHVYERRIASYRSSVKRFLDIFLTLLAMPILGPVIVLLAVMVAADGAAPFYGQNRIGRNGRVYRMCGSCGRWFRTRRRGSST